MASPVVVFDGSLGEKLVENQNINGSSATTADVTVYRPRGKDWDNYNKQLNGVTNRLVQLRRKWHPPFKLPYNK